MVYQDALNVMNFYGGYINALSKLFPDVKFDESRFSMLPSIYFILFTLTITYFITK